MTQPSMTEEEVEAYLDSKPGWAAFTVSARTDIRTPWRWGISRDGTALVMGCRDGTAKVNNVERNPKASAMLESGSTMADIKGVMLQGDATVHRSPDEVLHFMREGARRRGVPDDKLPTRAREGSVFIRLSAGQDHILGLFKAFVVNEDPS